MEARRVTVEYSEGARSLAEELFDPQVSDQDLAAAVGALAGAGVLFTIDTFHRLKSYVSHRWIEEQAQGRL